MGRRAGSKNKKTLANSTDTDDDTSAPASLEAMDHDDVPETGLDAIPEDNTTAADDNATTDDNATAIVDGAVDAEEHERQQAQEEQEQQDEEELDDLDEDDDEDFLEQANDALQTDPRTDNMFHTASPKVTPAPKVSSIFVDDDGNETPNTGEGYTLTRMNSGIVRRSEAVGTERKKLVSSTKRKRTEEETDPDFYSHEKLESMTAQGLQQRIKRLQARREVLKTDFAEKLESIETLINDKSITDSHKFASDFLKHILHNHILKEDADDIVENKLMTEVLAKGFEDLVFLLKAPAVRHEIQEELKAVVEEKSKRDEHDDFVKLEAKKEAIRKKHEKKRQKNLALLDSQETDY